MSRNCGHVTGVLLECLNERRRFKFHAKQFVWTSTHRNCCSVGNTPNITVSILTAAELQDNPIKSFVQALQRRPQKNSIVTVYYHVASLRLIYTCIYDWGGEGVRVELSMYKMSRKLTDWDKCHFSWQPSYEYTVLFLLLLFFFIYNFVVIFGIWVFGTRSSLPRTGCYSLKKRPLKVLRYRKIFGFVHLISSFLKYVTVVVTQKFHLCQVILDKSTISVIPIIQGCCHLLLMPNDGKFAGN